MQVELQGSAIDSSWPKVSVPYPVVATEPNMPGLAEQPLPSVAFQEALARPCLIIMGAVCRSTATFESAPRYAALPAKHIMMVMPGEWQGT